MSRGLAPLLAALVTLLAPAAQARALSYTVPVDTSLARLARDLYGRASAAAVLASANGRDLKAPVPAGTALRIPVSYRITARRQTTLGALARTHLKRKSRAVILAAVNNLDVDKPVAAGTALRVPALLWHTAGKGETLLTVSRLYYRNTDGRFVLRRVNSDRRGLAVATGEKLLVPIFADWTDEEVVRARLAALLGQRAPAESAAPAAAAVAGDDEIEAEDPRPDAGSSADAGPRADAGAAEDPRAAYATALETPLLRDGIALYRRGDYLACVAYFRRALLDPGLPPWPRVATQVWLASCYVATGEESRAEEVMRAALGVRPTLQLDPALTSPKVLQVLERARAQRRE